MNILIFFSLFKLAYSIILYIVSFVILGGISRIGKVASKIAPVMVLVYMLTVFYLMFLKFVQPNKKYNIISKFI